MEAAANDQPADPGQQEQARRGGGRGRGQRGGRSRGRGRSNPPPQQQQPQSGPTQPVKTAQPVAQTLAPPQNKEKNQKKAKASVIRDDAVFKEAVFSAERTLKPVSREINFTPASTGYTPLVNETFAVYRGEKRQQMGKEFPPELFQYYASSLYWLRVIGLKLSMGHVLTEAEDRVLQRFEDRKLSVPEPIFLALKAVGKVVTATGDTLVPEFPELPTQVTATYHGSLGVVTTDNHNVYEELPVIGPAIECLRQRLDGAQPNAGRTYPSQFAPANTVANINLQGFARLSHCRMEAIAFLENLNIQADQQFPTISQSGISYQILDAVSEYLATTESFKIYSCGVIEIPESGSTGQTVRAVPEITDLDDTTKASNVYVHMSAMIRESAVTAGVSEAFGLCQNKENRVEPGLPPWQSVTPWSAITFDNAAALAALPGYIASRNNRRNLPGRYADRCFIAAGDWSGDYRRQVIDRLVNKKQ